MIESIRNAGLLFVSIVLTTFVYTLKAQDSPFVVANALFDSGNTVTLGLEPAEGSETITVFAPSDTTDHFSNGVVLAAFKGNLYCMWQSSQKDEDAADTWVAYSRSTDDGKTWSAPMVLAETIANGYCSSGGWLATADSLVGYINTWPSAVSPRGGFTRYVASADGLTWTEPANVLMADGSVLNGIFEQDPHVLPDGRIVNAAHFQPGLFINPIYTDDPSGVRGWKRGDYTHLTTSGTNSIEMEPSLFCQDDGTLVMVFRDQNTSFHTWASTSKDRGEHWSTPVLTNMTDSRSKQSAGNLPDGTAFMVNNPIAQKSPRAPLGLTLSADGKYFDQAFLLRAAGEGLQAQRYTGKSKGLGYSYPKSITYKEYLYSSYSTNKEDVQYTRVPLQSISLNSALENADSRDMVQIRVYSDRLQVKLPEGENKAKLLIYNISGYKLMEVLMDSNVRELDLSAYPAGMYIISFATDKGKESKLINIK
ncbi:MAG: exo-alpha-sialidase [Bacteroidales bacterium]|nr:exo-alpha-sialidase [Bacteroidales bacterium]MDD4362022.1 exo-alpha-sialidase [Bacteroidales bacterium]